MRLEEEMSNLPANVIFLSFASVRFVWAIVGWRAI
jgi:hypothetical protein